MGKDEKKVLDVYQIIVKTECKLLCNPLVDVVLLDGSIHSVPVISILNAIGQVEVLQRLEPKREA